MTSSVYKLKANTYAHVLDNNTCEVVTLLGPLSLPLYEHHHKLHDAPQPCVVVPPHHYVTVENPARRTGLVDEAGFHWHSVHGAFTLVSGPALRVQRAQAAAALMGKKEIRFTQDPFPLFPGEVASAPQPMELLSQTEALLLEAVDAFTVPREGLPDLAYSAADRFLFQGPGYYRPRLEVRVLRREQALVVGRHEALHLRARVAFVEDDGTARAAQAEWTHRAPGAFFLHPNVALVRRIEGVPLTRETAVHIRALERFVDPVFKKARALRETWLVTQDDVPDVYVPSHMEEVVRLTRLVKVATRQYCVVRHPLRAGAIQWNERELREGPRHFFLSPGEALEGGRVRDAFTLDEHEALLVAAEEPFTDAGGVARAVASRWLVRGPCHYVPPLPVRVLEKRRVIPLTENEGVYVRHQRTGEVRAVCGRPFMLSEEEELWEKPMNPLVRLLLDAPLLSLREEDLPCMLGGAEGAVSQDEVEESFIDGATDLLVLAEQTQGLTANGVRVQTEDLSRFAMVSARAERNTLIRLYDVSKGTSRVVAGPATVLLEPHEEFTPISLSGGRPKQHNQIHCLSLYLGPDYMTDIIEVETLDHARLKLQLAYNWEFETQPGIQEIAFTIPDFVGEACKTLASRVRSALAGETFEEFHRNSSSLIKQAIFSDAADGAHEMRGEALYTLVNGLKVTSVDIQSVEPVDQRTRVALTKSVQLAVEIITKSQESEATHQAMLREQKARGALELQTV
ncbi:major vault protein-like protein [Strigomonas culicis]|uniref:Major vault protein-like protein n=1 Tax=Strigomonas culicis TaxID=28005 RepID=S9U5K5_9TRYP|nr:major vault protein-like protein [Strigomonas culicis]EPY26062.1 major vault protein-like protein [Strigomonas culicis]|eukprot:EPY22199.1 major vault protein-like protein [Strigomonas culicis]